MKYNKIFTNKYCLSLFALPFILGTYAYSEDNSTSKVDVDIMMKKYLV